MAEINKTEWLEEYLKMWTPKERMGRIHKVTTFDPTYHAYPEGVYLLDDDCRAHTAIYVVDKEHNVHIIHDGMAWDLLARAVEGSGAKVAGVLERMLTAENTCCAGLQGKLKRIGDQLERIANAIEDGITPPPAPTPKKTLFIAEPDRHEVTEDRKVYTSAVTSIVEDASDQPWTITDDVSTYPEWATVSTDKGHVYITTDGSKPGKGKNDPWHIEPGRMEFSVTPDRHEVTDEWRVYTSAVTSVVDDAEGQPWTITDNPATYPEWATVYKDEKHVYITTDGSKPGK